MQGQIAPAFLFCRREHIFNKDAYVGDPTKPCVLWGRGGCRPQTVPFRQTGERNRYGRKATSGGVGDEDVGYSANQLAILQNRTAAHMFINIGPTNQPQNHLRPSLLRLKIRMFSHDIEYS